MIEETRQPGSDLDGRPTRSITRLRLLLMATSMITSLPQTLRFTTVFR